MFSLFGKDKGEDCSNNSGPCVDHKLTMHRLDVLEEAKSALCETSKDLHTAQLKNTSAIRIAGTIITLCAISMLAVSAVGWIKMQDFTKDFYQMREADRQELTIYMLQQQDVDKGQDKKIELLHQELQLSRRIIPPPEKAK